MKYFRHILMGHEIFLKILDGPQNIFWCSFQILTFCKFIWKFKWVWAENVRTGHREKLRKIRHVKQQIKSFEMHDNGSTRPKINIWCILSLLLGSLTLVLGYKIRLSDDFSSVDFIYLIASFLRIIWINKLHDLMKTFFPNKYCYGIRKKTFFQLS